MSIFVDEKETFPINVYYKEVRDDEGNLLYNDVAVDSPERNLEDYEKLTAWFCQPSDAVFGAILEEATVLNALNQRPVIRTRVLRDMTLQTLMKEWSAKDDNDNPIPITPDTLGALDIKIANELFLQYMYQVQLDVQLEAIIKNESENDRIFGG